VTGMAAHGPSGPGEETGPVTSPSEGEPRMGAGESLAGDAAVARPLAGADDSPPSAPSAEPDLASPLAGADESPQSAPSAEPDLASPLAGADESPMMRQYREWKRRYPDYLLLFRLGAFYQGLHQDAPVGARGLDTRLTSRAAPGRRPHPRRTPVTPPARPVPAQRSPPANRWRRRRPRERS